MLLFVNKIWAILLSSVLSSHSSDKALVLPQGETGPEITPIVKEKFKRPVLVLRNKTTDAGDDSYLLAGHRSHSSHRSHASHASHSSHYSSTSTPSHYSSTSVPSTPTHYSAVSTPKPPVQQSIVPNENIEQDDTAMVTLPNLLGTWKNVVGIKNVRVSFTYSEKYKYQVQITVGTEKYMARCDSVDSNHLELKISGIHLDDEPAIWFYTVDANKLTIRNYGPNIFPTKAKFVLKKVILEQ